MNKLLLASALLGSVTLVLTAAPFDAGDFRPLVFVQAGNASGLSPDVQRVHLSQELVSLRSVSQQVISAHQLIFRGVHVTLFKRVLVFSAGGLVLFEKLLPAGQRLVRAASPFVRERRRLDRRPD